MSNATDHGGIIRRWWNLITGANTRHPEAYGYTDGYTSLNDSFRAHRAANPGLYDFAHVHEFSTTGTSVVTNTAPQTTINITPQTTINITSQLQSVTAPQIVGSITTSQLEAVYGQSGYMTQPSVYQVGYIGSGSGTGAAGGAGGAGTVYLHGTGGVNADPAWYGNTILQVTSNVPTWSTFTPYVPQPQPTIPVGARWRDKDRKVWTTWDGSRWVDDAQEPDVEVPDPAIAAKRKFSFEPEPVI